MNIQPLQIKSNVLGLFSSLLAKSSNSWKGPYSTCKLLKAPYPAELENHWVGKNGTQKMGGNMFLLG